MSGAADALAINTITIDPLQAKDTFDVTANVTGAVNVSFAVWGDVNGQNDTYWHQGYDQGNGNWTCTVDWTQHKKETGTYTVVAYAKDASGKLISKQASTKPTVSGETQGVAVIKATQLNVRSGPGTQYASLGKVNRPETYTLREVVQNEAGESWLAIDYKGTVGYIKNEPSYVEIK